MHPYKIKRTADDDERLMKTIQARAMHEEGHHEKNSLHDDFFYAL